MLINEKVAYLKGIIDTANISADKPENRLLLEIVNALELIAFELDDQGQELSELDCDNCDEEDCDCCDCCDDGDDAE